MQEFFINYGLWLLIALLVVIGVIFLLSGRKPADVIAHEPEQPLPAAAPPPVVEDAVLAVPPASPAPVDPAPVTEAPAPAIPVSPAVTATDDAPDDLLRLKGVGPKLNTLLLDLGVTRYAQIAAWTETDVAAIDARLGAFKGRPVRDQWIDQAKYLAAGDVAGFEAKYGKL
jgi:predicted flap endonuclease-1-like 5' DNA nuclease